jgi:hypothetical protein
MEAGIDRLDVAAPLLAVPGRRPAARRLRGLAVPGTGRARGLRGLAMPGHGPARRRVRLRVLPRHGPARRVRLPAVPTRRPRLPECHRDTWLSHESTLCHTPTSFAVKPCTSIPAMGGPDGYINSLLHASARHCDRGARADPISHYSFSEHLSLQRSRQYGVALARQSFASCPFQRKALRHHVRRLLHLAPQLA